MDRNRFPTDSENRIVTPQSTTRDDSCIPATISLVEESSVQGASKTPFIDHLFAGIPQPVSRKGPHQQQQQQQHERESNLSAFRHQNYAANSLSSAKRASSGGLQQPIVPGGLHEALGHPSDNDFGDDDDDDLQDVDFNEQHQENVQDFNNHQSWQDLEFNTRQSMLNEDLDNLRGSLHGTQRRNLIEIPLGLHHEPESNLNTQIMDNVEGQELHDVIYDAVEAGIDVSEGRQMAKSRDEDIGGLMPDGGATVSTLLDHVEEAPAECGQLEDPIASPENSFALHASNGESQVNAASDQPWWMEALIAEGVFEIDTSTVFPDRAMVPAEPNSELDKNDQGVANPKQIPEHEAEPLQEEDDIMGEEAIGDGMEDWQERLWIAARKHWIPENRETGIAATDENETDMVALMASVDQADAEREGVLAFRTQLRKCIEAYIQVFHVTPIREGCPCLPDGAAQLSPFVPLRVAVLLFQHVLRTTTDCDADVGAGIHESGSLVEAAGVVKSLSNTSQNSSTNRDSVDLKRCTNALLSDELGAFHRYSVNAPKMSADEGTKVRDAAGPPDGNRVSSDLRQKQMELEESLYGDMKAELESMRQAAAEQAIDEAPDQEEEICLQEHSIMRLREATADAAIPTVEREWRYSFAEVLVNALHSSETVDKRSLAYMYTVRYLPHFFVRASYHCFPGAVIESPPMNKLKQFFCDAEYIRSRLTVLGIYNAVLVHVEELESFFELIRRDPAQNNHWKEFYADANETLAGCLRTLMDDTMGSAGFALTKPSPPQWTRLDRPKSSFARHDHAKTVSSCLEIGRSLHHLGIMIGRGEQDRVQSGLEGPGFDERLTEMECKAYEGAWQGLQAGLSVLQREEERLRNRSGQSEAMDFGELRQRLEQIREARETIELFKADALTTLSYCYEAKLGKKEDSLLSYREGLAIYVRHIGMNHATVIHTLQRMGSLNMELERWRDALQCFNECLTLMKNNGATTILNLVKQDITSSAPFQFAQTLRNMGVILMIVGDIEAAVKHFQEAIEMLIRFECQIPESDSVARKVHIRPFMGDLMSKLANAYLDLSSRLKVAVSKKYLSLVYLEHKFDEMEVDSLVARRLQAERKALEMLRDSINIRRDLLSNSTPFTCQAELQSSNSEVQLPIHGLLKDLINYGKLCFRRRKYEDARMHWKEALSFARNQLGDFEGPGDQKGNKDTSVRTLTELLYLLGTVSARLKATKEAIHYFQEARNGLQLGTGGIPGVELDVSCCEHSLGLAFLECKEKEKAVLHLEEALRVLSSSTKPMNSETARNSAETNYLGGGLDFESPGQENFDPNSISGNDIFKNAAIARITLSLGALYHDRMQTSSARRCLSGSIRIVDAIAKKFLSSEVGNRFDGRGSTLAGDLSLMALIHGVGDAHRRLAILNVAQGHVNDAFHSFEAAVCCFEWNKLHEFSIFDSDDENEPSFMGWEDVNNLLIGCYKNMLLVIDQKQKLETARNFTEASKRHSGDQPSRDINAQQPSYSGSITREDVMIRMGNVFARMSRHTQALECLLEARVLIITKLGTSDHPVVANLLYNLGNVYRAIAEQESDSGIDPKSNGKSRRKAIDAVTESMRIAKDCNLEDNLGTADSMETLASLLMGSCTPRLSNSTNEENDATAIRLLRDAIQIRKKLNGENTLPYAKSLHCLGVLLLRRRTRRQAAANEKDIDEAIHCLYNSLRIQETILGEHLDVAATLHFVGLAMKEKAGVSQERRMALFDEALKHMSRSLQIRSGVLEAVEPTTSSSPIEPGCQKHGTQELYNLLMGVMENLYDVAMLHGIRREWGLARQLLKEALATLDSATDVFLSQRRHPDRSAALPQEFKAWKANIWHRVAVIEAASGDCKEAIKACQESLHFRGFVVANDLTSDEVFDSLTDEQIDVLDRVSLQETAATLRHLATAYRQLGCFDDAIRCFIHCVQASRTCYGSHSLEVAEALGELGHLYYENKEYAKFIQVCQQIFHIQKTALGARKPIIDDAKLHMRYGRSLMDIGGAVEEIRNHLIMAVDVIDDAIHMEAEGAGEIEVSRNDCNELLLECLTMILQTSLVTDDEEMDAQDDQYLVDVKHRMGALQADMRQYDAAIKTFSELLDVQWESDDGDRLKIADLLFNLGNVYLETGDLEKARKCHEESHGIYASIVGDDSGEIADNMACLGNVEFRCGKNMTALEWYDRALFILHNCRADDVATIGKLVFRKGVVYDRLELFDKAVECYSDVLKSWRRLWGPDHVELADVLNSLGNAYRKQSEPQKALRCYEECLRIRLVAGDEIQVANTKNNIGAVLAILDEKLRAKAFYAQALRLKNDALGPFHVETARTIYNIGQLFVEEKKLDQGLRFFLESVRIFKTTEGDKNVDVAACLYNIANIFEQKNDQGMALRYYADALVVLERANGEDRHLHASTLQKMASLLLKEGKSKPSIKCLKKALEIRSTTNDIEEIMEAKFSLAKALHITGGSLDEAKVLHEEALVERKKLLGHDHYDVARSLFGLAQVFHDLGSHDQALSLLLECSRIQKKAAHVDPVELSDTELLLGESFRETGDCDAALKHLEIALKLKSSLNGNTSLQVASVNFHMGQSLWHMGHLEESLACHDEALRVRKLVLGEDHPDVGSSIQAMGLINQSSGEHQRALDLLNAALDVIKRVVGEDAEEVAFLVHAIAICYYEGGNYDEALRLLAETITRKKSLTVVHNNEVARAILDQGRIFRSLGQNTNSIDCYQQALSLIDIGRDSWLAGQVYMKMGEAQLMIGAKATAWTCFLKAVEYLESPTLRLAEATTSERLLWYQRITMSTEDLTKCYDHMFVISQVQIAGFHVDRASFLPRMAQHLMRVENYQRAVSVLRDALVQLRLNNSNDVNAESLLLHSLGTCAYHLADFGQATVCLQEALIFRGLANVSERNLSDTYHCLALVNQSRSDYANALRFYEQALTLRRNQGDHLALATTLCNSGVVLHALGMYDASIKSCKDATRALDDSGKQDNSIRSNILTCLGSNYKDRGEYEKSLRSFTECLELRESTAVKDNVFVGESLFEMGTVYELRGEISNANECFKRAGVAFSAHLGLQTAFTGERLNLIAGDVLLSRLVGYCDSPKSKNMVVAAEYVSTFGSLMEKLDYNEYSILSFNFALDLFRARLSPDHLSIAKVNYKLGVVLLRTGEFDKAITRLTEALVIRKKRLGDKHVDVEATLRSLGRASSALSRSSDALEYFRQAIICRRERAGVARRCDDEIEILLRMGKLHLEQRESKEALACFRECMKLFIDAYGQNKESVRLGVIMSCMGSAMHKSGLLEESCARLVLASQVLERTGAESLELVEAYSSLGQVYQDMKRFEEAREAIGKSLTVLHNRGGNDRRVSARVNLQLGLVCLAASDSDAAASFLEHALQEFETIGNCQLDFAECLQGLGTVSLAKKDPATARDWFMRSLRLRQELLDAGDARVGESLHLLGLCLVELEDYHEAGSYLSESLSIRIRKYGADDRLVGETHRCLAQVELMIANPMAALKHYEKAINIAMTTLHEAADVGDEEFFKLFECINVALALAKPGKSDKQLGKLCHQRGSLQCKKKLYRDALESFSLAIRHYKECFGDVHLTVANVFFNMGVCLNATGDPERASQCLVKALRITATELGGDHPEAAEAMEHLGESYKQMGDVDQSLTWCEKALAIRKYTEDLTLAALLHFTGDLYGLAGRIDDAEKCLRESIRIKRTVLGSDDPDVANSLLSLGFLYEVIRQENTKALRCYEECLRIRKKQCDDRGMDVASAYLRLGCVHLALRNDQKAAFCFDRAVMTCSEDCVHYHPIISTAWTKKGRMLLLTGQPREALQVLARALQMRQEALGGRKREESEESAEILCLQAAAYDSLNEEANALGLLGAALRVYKAKVGEESHQTASVLQQMAEIYLSLESFDDAMKCAQGALKLRRRVYGEDHLETGDSYFIVGKICFQTKDYDMSLKCFRSALSSHQSRRGQSHASVTHTHYYIGCIHEFREQFDEALSCFQRCLSNRKYNMDHDLPIMSKVLYKLGSLHKSRSEFETAVDCLQECLRIRSSLLGPDHSEVADTLFLLAGASAECRFTSPADKEIRKNETAKYYMDAMRIYREKEDHLSVANCLAGLGAALEDETDKERAIGCYDKAIAIYCRHLKIDKHVTREEVEELGLIDNYKSFAAAVFDYASFLDVLNEEESASEMNLLSLHVHQIVHGREHTSVATILFNQATLLGRQNLFPEALELFREAIRMRKSLLGDDDSSVGDIYLAMGILYDKMQSYDEAMSALEECMKIRSHQTTGNALPLAMVLTHIGIVHGNRADFSAALSCWDDALALYKQCGLPDEDPAVMAVQSYKVKAKEMLEKMMFRMVLQ